MRSDIRLSWIGGATSEHYVWYHMYRLSLVEVLTPLLPSWIRDQSSFPASRTLRTLPASTPSIGPFANHTTATVNVSFPSSAFTSFASDGIDISDLAERGCMRPSSWTLVRHWRCRPTIGNDSFCRGNGTGKSGSHRLLGAFSRREDPGTSWPNRHILAITAASLVDRQTIHGFDCTSPRSNGSANDEVGKSCRISGGKCAT